MLARPSLSSSDPRICTISSTRPTAGRSSGVSASTQSPRTYSSFSRVVARSKVLKERASSGGRTLGNMSNVCSAEEANLVLVRGVQTHLPVQQVHDMSTKSHYEVKQRTSLENRSGFHIHSKVFRDDITPSYARSGQRDRKWANGAPLGGIVATRALSELARSRGCCAGRLILRFPWHEDSLTKEMTNSATAGKSPSNITRGCMTIAVNTLSSDNTIEGFEPFSGKKNRWTKSADMVR